MKTHRIFLVLVIFFPILLNAQQLKVRSDGNVVAFTTGFSEDSEDDVSKFSIKSNTMRALRLIRSGTAALSSWSFGLECDNAAALGVSNVGIYGRAATSSSSTTSGRGYGVLGTAGNTTSGYNYGVVGFLTGTQNGAGVWGGFTYPQNIPGRYAGYFEGDVKVTGLINGVTIAVASDVKYKQNIVELRSQKESVLKNVLNLNPVEYNLKQTYLENVSDTARHSQKLFDENSEQFKKKHFGLIAQEVQQLYPDLVYEDGNGSLSINYIGLIPLLITSLKEMQAEIDVLKEQPVDKLIVTDPVIGFRSDTEEHTVTDLPGAVIKPCELYQNAPNPFNKETQIKFYLPKNVQVAQLCIYNLQGTQIKQILLTQRGEGSQRISGSELVAGMYLYSLIVDGKEVDTKRMVLTK